MPLSTPRTSRLTDMAVGCSVRFHEARVDAESCAQLRALGVIDGTVLRVCKQGQPCVVQVRTTRIGISKRVAREVFVVPVGAIDVVDLPCR